MKSNTLTADVSPESRGAHNGATDRNERGRKVSERLEYLSTVKDGWLEGRGVAPDGDGLVWLDQRLQEHYVETELPLPHLYATEPGGIMGEWSLERFECAIEIDLEARTGSWVDVDLETGDGIDERILGLDSADGWRWLTGRLGRFVG